MLDQLFVIFLSAVIGGFVGTLISTFLPKLLFDPRIEIVDIVVHNNGWGLIVLNKGRTAATNAIGRITIRPIKEDCILGSREEIFAARQGALPDDWRRSINAHLRTEDWETGIETEHSHWAASTSKENAHIRTINPGLPERLVLAQSESHWVDIPSEHTDIKRARLKLDDSDVYYGEVVIGASNSRLSKPFRFTIKLGQNGRAHIEPYHGKLPNRNNNTRIDAAEPAVAADAASRRPRSERF